jgi:hypothetical protein
MVGAGGPRCERTIQMTVMEIKHMESIKAAHQSIIFLRRAVAASLSTCSSSPSDASAFSVSNSFDSSSWGRAIHLGLYVKGNMMTGQVNRSNAMGVAYADQQRRAVKQVQGEK